MLRHANRRQASLLISLLCLNSALFTSVLTACGSGDTCSQCDGGSGGMGNGGSAGDASGGSAGASTGGSGDASANVVAYCDCMLNSCHDEYHATWGEDHIVAEAQCHAEAGMVPENGSATESGDFIECRLAACQRAGQDANACAAALGGDVCAAP
ncbi:MAG: hypothetical protein AB7K71_40130 [Polyangiaceae bacterium]